jgi:cysteine synthase A
VRIAEDITRLIGHTPLVRLNLVIKADSNLIVAKLEQFNPCSSIKDRPAVSMINDAEQKGLLKPGATIVEGTSGNTGIALAFIAAARHYKLIIVMPDSMTLERQNLLRLFGTRVELTPAHLGMKGAIDRAEAIRREIPDSFLVRQFENPANTRAHEETTAEEILADMDGNVDILVAGVGTGGTITGIAGKLKQRNPSITTVAVEPTSSAVLSGGKGGPHMIQGIGAGFIPPILNTGLIDEVITVSDEETMLWTRKLIREEGILAGLSSGAAVCATQKYLAAHDVKNKNIVLIFPDSGERYASVTKLLKE